MKLRPCLAYSAQGTVSKHDLCLSTQRRREVLRLSFCVRFLSEDLFFLVIPYLNLRRDPLSCAPVAGIVAALVYTLRRRVTIYPFEAQLYIRHYESPTSQRSSCFTQTSRGPGVSCIVSSCKTACPRQVDFAFWRSFTRHQILQGTGSTCATNKCNDFFFRSYPYKIF